MRSRGRATPAPVGSTAAARAQAMLSVIDSDTPPAHLLLGSDALALVRAKLVEMHRQVAVARTYTLEVARRHVAGETVIAEACLAKQTAVDAAVAVTNDAVQLFGGAGYMHGTEVERHYRDSRILGIGGGTTEIMKEIIGRSLGI